MFTQAMFRQLSGSVEQIGFNFDPAIVNANFDYVVVPAANWLNARAEWDWLTALIERLEIPVVTIGLGLQAETTDPTAIKVSESSIRLARTLSRKAPFMSTRGHFTTAFLQSIGIMNVVTTGCPSLYMALEQSRRADGTGDGLVIQSTRYGFTRDFLDRQSVNRTLFEVAARLDADIVFQSEPEEIEFLVYGSDASGLDQPRVADIAKLYGMSDIAQLKQYLSRRGHVYFDIDRWNKYIFDKAVLVGTRLHGAILALNTGISAFLIAHDSRTSELVEFAKIPTMSDAQLYACRNEKEFLDLKISDQQHQYYETRSFSAKIYKSFLESNKVSFYSESVLS